MRSALFASILLALTLHQSAGASDEGRFTIVGAGIKSCTDFNSALAAKEVENENYRVFIGWLAGYVTAHNFYIQGTKDILGEHDLQSAVSLVEDFCFKHPKAHFSDASLSSVAQMIDFQLAKSVSHWKTEADVRLKRTPR